VGSAGEERETGDARESWGRGGTGMRESRPGEMEGPARAAAGADDDAEDGGGAPPPSGWTGTP
jgi:hypothetical protein